VLDRLAILAGRVGRVEMLLTMFDDGRPLTAAIDALPRRASWLSGLPGGGGLRRWLLPLYPTAVAQLGHALARLHRRRPIDLVVSSSSAAIKGLAAPPGVAHLCYCHSPARYLWDARSEYGDGSAGGRLRAAGLALAGPALRAWDRATADRVDAFYANSAHVARRIEACYGRSAAVVHPPVRTGYFTPDPDRRRGTHWLVVGAIEPYKRTAAAMEAARLAGVELRVVGDGSQRRRLEAAAWPGVRFLGRLDDADLREQMRSAAVLLFPQVEDFGIVAAEAQACGLPVAATAAGGALDIVRDGVTGALCDGSPGALAAAADRATRCDPRACAANALRFTESAFDEAMAAAIDAALRARHQ